MGANAEGKISLSVELQNFKDIANSLKKGLSQELKQIPLDVKFNNKDLEEQAAAALKDINKMFTETRLKNLDFSSILPAFINEINRGDISDEIRVQVIEGLKAGLTNLKEGGLKQNYTKIKNFNGDDLLRYFLDSNSVEDILGTFNGLSKRQKQGLRSSVLPSLSELKGRGWDAADKEYTKGAKRLEALMQLSGEYGDVMQYGTNPTATKNIIAELDKRFKEGNISKIDAQDIIGYLLRSEFLGIDLGKEISSADLLKEAENVLGDSASAISERLKERAQAFFTAYDNIFNSTAKKITYTELLNNVDNTTNKRFQGLYNTEAPKDLEKVDVGKLFKESVKIKSDEKPDLRKRKKDERIKDTTGTKTKSKNKDEEEFKFDDEEDEIQDYDKKINEITEELKKVRDKIDEAKERQQQLKKEIENQQKITDEKTQAYLNYKEDYYKYSSSAKKAKQDASALKETVEGLNKQLEEEKQNKEQIENKYNELIAKRESIKKEIEEKEKQLNAILPNAEKQEADIENRINELNNKKTEKEADVKSHEEGIKNQDDWLKWYDIALKNEYKFEGSKAKSEAYEALKSLGKKYLEFKKNPNSSTATDKQAEAARFAVRHYKLWQAAKEAGVAESRLENEKFDTDDDIAYKQAVEYLQQQRGNTEKRREQIKNELDKTKAEIIGIKTEIEQAEAELKLAQEQKRKLLNELRVKPAKKEDDNESNIKREKIKLDSSNSKIQKIEGEKTEAENRLQKVEKYLEKNELTPEREKQHENRLKQLEEESNTQGEILQQKKKDLEREIEETNKLIELGKELIAKQDLLIQKQAEAKKKQEELDKQEEERKKQAEADKTKTDDNKADSVDSDTGESQSSKGSGTTGNTGTSIPPEKLEEILTLLGNIQKALGTLEDGSDIPSITQSVKNMVDALKELSDALGEIKQKDFNLNIGLPNNNPIGQKGEAKRKILKELEQQYNEYMKFYGGKEGLFVSANKYNKQSSEYDNIGEQIANQFLMPKQFDTSSLIGQIDELQYKLNLLFQFSKANDFDLNEILSNAKSPSEIIKQINEDVVNANPATAISKIFEDMKISIDASLAQINTESKGFSFLSGSAEEAAEAKRKFVEANKEVFQSIVASMPKIEKEADALKKVEEAKEENNKISDTSIEDESNIEEQKKQIEEIAKKKKEVQEQYENQFHSWGEDGQLSFLDKNDYDLQNEYLELQKQEAEQLTKQAEKQAEKNASKFKIPIKGQLSFTNLQNENIFDNMLPEDILSNYGDILGEDLSKSITLGLEKKLTSVDSAGFADELLSNLYEEYTNAADSIEARFASLLRSKDFIQGEDVSEKFLETYEGISTEKIQELFKTIQELKQVKASLQDSFDENGNLIGDPIQVQDIYETYNRLIEIVRRLKLEISGNYSEETAAFKMAQDAKNAEEKLNQLKITIEKTFSKISSSKEFIQGKDVDIDYIDKYGDFKDTDNLLKLSEFYNQLKNVKSELSSSFDEQGNLLGDPNKTNELLSQYELLIDKIKKLKFEIESPNSEETIALQLLKESKDAENGIKELTVALEKMYPKLPSAEKTTVSIEKFLQPFGDLPITESVNQLIDYITRIREISSELSSSFDSQGKLIGDPKDVQALILEYKNLTNQIGELKTKISSPLSEENIALKLAKDADKAKKELEDLKNTIDTVLGKSGLFEAQTQKTINSYGAFDGDDNGQRLANLKDVDTVDNNFKQQQIQVRQLVTDLEEYKQAIKELKTLRDSDDTTSKQLEEANNKVKALKDSITTLSQTIKASGIANATEEQIGSLKIRLESFLENTPYLTENVRAQLQKYVDILKSGASVSKTSYNSMAADLKKFTAAQSSGTTIWDQMVGKMREGIAFLATKFSFYQIFNQFRQGFEVIHQFDDALTEMMKVSDETRLSLERYQKTTFDTADAIGTSALQIQNSTADFMRLGETLDKAAESAKSANILMNVSEFQSIDEATKSLIAMGAAYDDLSKMNIIDKLNEVGNNYAISTSEAATALQSSASALKTAGNDMDEALALVTAGNAVVQDATKVGIKDAQR